MAWKSIPGETPVDDLSGLKIKTVRTRRQLAIVEAENIRKATLRCATQPFQGSSGGQFSRFGLEQLQFLRIRKPPWPFAN